MAAPRKATDGYKFSPVDNFFFHNCSIMSSVVLVTGASGLLGRQVFNTFQHSGVLVVGQGYSRAAPPTILRADLEKSEDIKSLLDEVK
jgi:NAD(P)-dependent dehydrogenase (short-subunit alcohol dehydrogenase family)